MTLATDSLDLPALPLTRPVLLGLIGSGISLSRSPAIHMGAARDLGTTCLYQLIDLDRLGLDAKALPDLLTAAERMGFAGLNITFPCKQEVIPLLTRLSPDAAALGAVNTVVLRDGQRIGHNTDWVGYAEALVQALPKADLSRLVQFGAGGAGSAVAYGLLKRGAGHVSLVERDAERAEQLADLMTRAFGPGRISIAQDAETAVAQATGLINCTPVGMAKFPGMPFPAEWLKADQFVSEIIYFPLETELLRQARAKGCATVDGSGMNILQAAEAFRLFTGHQPDTAKMRVHFDEAGEAH